MPLQRRGLSGGKINTILDRFDLFCPSNLRPQTRVKWDDVYVRAGVTASELKDIIVARGGGGVRPSKMCVSLLESGSGRRAAGAGKGGAVVQIAGPDGAVREWKASAALLLSVGRDMACDNIFIYVAVVIVVV